MARLDTTLPDRRLMETIPVEVRRSRRRRTRIGLAFDPGGFVIVEAPLDASDGEIRAVIREHRRWLRHRLDKVTSNIGLTGCVQYVAGEVFHYLGEVYVLEVGDGDRDDVALEARPATSASQLALFQSCSVRGQLRVRVKRRVRAGRALGTEDRVKALLKAWYRARASERFAIDLEGWRCRLPWLRGAAPAWRHRYMRSQWGSCNRIGRISLNTHLVKTPPRLIEYVVLHELCHLQHYDHGPRFHGLMTRYMPDWRERRLELDQFSPVLLQD